MINPQVVQDHKTCPVCQNTLRKKWNAEFYECTNCGLIIRRPVEGLEGLYKKGWQTPLENLFLTGGTTPDLALNYTRELLRTLRLKNLKGKRILDFGGGRGELALVLKEVGAEVVSVDPYSYSQLKQMGLTSYESLDGLVDGTSFDGAIAIDVIEHLTFPWEELLKIRDLLKDDGWLFLSTPNVNSLNAILNRQNWREARNPSHLLLFSPNSVKITLIKSGFKKFQRLRWRVDYSGKRLIQIKDFLLRTIWKDGVLRYIAFKNN